MNPTPAKSVDALGSSILSIALIGPADVSRKPIAAALASLHAAATREFPAYPELDDVPRLLDSGFDVVIVELDSNPEYALELVENICGNGSVTVMVYSEQVFPEMLVRCMRAGAREFLTHPVTSTSIAEAMVRASVRRPSGHAVKKQAGKLLIFADDGYRQGRLPLWNPYLYCGMSQLAVPSPGMFYPPTACFFLPFSRGTAAFLDTAPVHSRSRHVPFNYQIGLGNICRHHCRSGFRLVRVYVRVTSKLYSGSFHRLGAVTFISIELD